MNHFTYNTYAEHLKAAEHFMEMATIRDLGKQWNIVAAITFSAFAIEAFINHVGEVQDASWSEWDKENHPSPKDKLLKLSVALDKNINSQFVELFKLRDMVAHGRTITIEKNVRKPPNNLKGSLVRLSSDFSSRTTIEKTQNLVSASKNIVSFINDATIKLSAHKLTSIGGGSVRIS